MRLKTFEIAAAICLLFFATKGPAFAHANPYGDAYLNNLETQIEKAQSGEECDKLVDRCRNAYDLGCLGVWAALGSRVNLKSSVVTPQCLIKLGRMRGKDAQAAVNRIKYALRFRTLAAETIMETIAEQNPKLTSKDVDRLSAVDVAFDTSSPLSKLPLTPELAQYRLSISESLWKSWERFAPKGLHRTSSELEIRVEPDGRVSIKPIGEVAEDKIGKEHLNAAIQSVRTIQFASPPKVVGKFVIVASFS